MATYDIYFSGQILEGQDPALVRQRIGRLFKAQDAALDRLFSGTPVRIKAGVDQETAIKFRVAFRDAGASVDIRPAGQAPTAAATPRPAAPAAPRPAAPPRPAAEPVHKAAFGAADETPPEPGRKAVFGAADETPAAPVHKAVFGTPDEAPATEPSRKATFGAVDETPATAPAAKAPPAATGGGIELLPPRTGSLEEFAIEEEPMEIPNVDNIGLGQTGAVLDNTPPPPPPKIDTSGITLGPARPDGPIDDTPPPPPLKLDLSGLDLEEANTGSLEEFAKEEKPVPLPDISGLKLGG